MSRTRPRLRLLVLLPFAPRLDAADGGGRAAAQLLAHLAVRHEVALLYLRAENEPALDEALRGACALAEEVVRPSLGLTPLQQGLRSAKLAAFLLSGQPMWVTDTRRRAYSARLRTLAHEWQPDIVQIEFHIMGQYLPALAGCRAARLLTEYEPGIRSAPYLKQLPPLLKNLSHSLDRLAWQKFEPAILRQVHAAVVFTEQDRATLAGLGVPTPLYTIRPGTVLPEQPLDPLGAGPPTLVFVGSFVHPPNIEAALRLGRRILPLVHAGCPEARLNIIGDQPPHALRRLAGPLTAVTGWVPDVTPYLDQAALFVAPLRSGGGVRVKVLEALAAGKAVVASPLAVEGLDVSAGEQVALAESDEEFSATILRLLADPAERAALARRGRSWAQANLAWDASVAAYEALYQHVLDGGCGGQT